jgi:hypothetical protein
VAAEGIASRERMAMMTTVSAELPVAPVLMG